MPNKKDVTTQQLEQDLRKTAAKRQRAPFRAEVERYLQSQKVQDEFEVWNEKQGE